jgi:hypothetical protein
VANALTAAVRIAVIAGVDHATRHVLHLEEEHRT